MSLSIEAQWNKLLYKISTDFNVDADQNGVLLLKRSTFINRHTRNGIGI